MDNAIIEKITKLLALSESPNENEAKAALLKAKEMMAAHKLEMSDIRNGEVKNIVEKLSGIRSTKTTAPWAVNLSVIIAQNYCCIAYRKHAKYDRSVEVGFVGHEDDVAICSRVYNYAYTFLFYRCAEICAAAKNDWYSLADARAIAKSYGFGFCAGLKNAFDAQKANNQEWGLVVVVPKDVRDYTDAKMPKRHYNVSAGKATAAIRAQQAKAWRDGHETGERFNVDAKLLDDKLHPQKEKRGRER